MNADLEMIGQKGVDEFGFVGPEIVGDDMDIASERPLHGQEGDELGAGMDLERPARISLLRVSRAEKLSGIAKATDAPDLSGLRLCARTGMRDSR